MPSAVYLLIRWALFFAGLYLFVGGILAILNLSGVLGGAFAVVPMSANEKAPGYALGSLYIVGGLALIMLSYNKSLRA
jgi:hypothetical protein